MCIRDRIVVERFGYRTEELLLFVFMIGVVPYCVFYFLTNMPLSKYLYCLGSVSIQAFFINGLLESFQITQSTLVEAPTLSGFGWIALLAILDAFIIYVFRRFAAPLFRNYQNAGAWKRLMVSPLSGSIALGAFYYLTDFKTGSYKILLIFTACYVALFIADIAALYGIGTSIRATEAEERLESANLILSSEKEQYRRLSDSIAQTRQARHDLRHHLNAVSGFLAADDNRGLQNYLADWGQVLSESEDYLYTGNYTADIIVGHYLSRAKQNGVRVDFSLHIPEDCCIRDTDLCVLMGNCLENAIDACGKLPSDKRFLRVESAVKNKYLAITIANSYDGNAAVRDGAYMSDKRQRQIAGIGFESVAAVVRSYHGEMKLENKGGVFTVYIMLKMLPKESSINQ